MANASGWHHLYNGKRWHRLRWHQLQREPLCRFCAALGQTTAATVIDHKTPHKGDEALFFDEGNLQSLCEAHHNSSKQRAEKAGVAAIGCDINGVPISDDHHWSL